MVSPDQAQVVRSAPLHEAQIVGVIHYLAEIRIFKIDSDLHMVLAVADRAVEIGYQCSPSCALYSSSDSARDHGGQVSNGDDRNNPNRQPRNVACRSKSNHSKQSYRQILVTAWPVRRRRLRADGQSVWR